MLTDTKIIRAQESYAFINMYKVVSSLRLHFKHNIGNENQTHIYKHWWIGEKKISSSSTPIQPFHMYLRFQTLQYSQWNARLIWNKFNKSTSKNILDTHLPITPKQDIFYRSSNIRGIYTVKSGYWSLRSLSPHQPRSKDNFWNLLWGLDILQKWKLFI